MEAETCISKNNNSNNINNNSDNNNNAIKKIEEVPEHKSSLCATLGCTLEGDLTAINKEESPLTDAKNSTENDSSESKLQLTSVAAPIIIESENLGSHTLAPSEPIIAPLLPITSSPDTWLLAGPSGSRTSYLAFRSCALANPSQASIASKPASKLHVTYRALQAETKLLSKLLACHGVTEATSHSTDYNLLWTGSHPKPGLLRTLAIYQRVNHFPRSYELTRKDRLYKNIERMQHALGQKHFDFIPQTFLMPGEYAELCSTHHRVKGPWIVKPVASSRGRGIFIVETPHEVPLDEPVVVAKYICRPMLLEGHKCDLRLYVVVTSFDPLLVYIYEEGLVRFATVKYDVSHKQLWNPCMHLCNYSINKYHSDYVKSDDPTAENVGHKWTLSALLRHLKSEDRDTAMLMAHIEDLIIKAILASANSIVAACKMFVPHNFNCFELYGFDILIDSDLKPWLLEVNLSPSLGCDSPLDVRLKSAMLSDLLTLVGVPAVDPMLRPSVTSVVSSSKASTVTQNSKSKFQNCRRVNSADGLSNTLPKKSTTTTTSQGSSSTTATTTTSTMSAEEMRIVRHVVAQFNRRGGFVRIYPAADSWLKYSQYLDATTGVPISGNPTTDTYTDPYARNLNLLLFRHLFPEIPIHHPKGEAAARMHPRISSLDRKRELLHTATTVASPTTQQQQENNSSNSSKPATVVLLKANNTNQQKEAGMNGAGGNCSNTGSNGGTINGIVTAQQRQDRYERMLSQGHRAALPVTTNPSLVERHLEETRKHVVELLRDGKKLSQSETRKTFSHYLMCILRRMSATVPGPDQDYQVDVVLKFLQKASNNLRTPFYVKNPSQQLDSKDRAAIVAKQLNDFLYQYNRETEPFSSDFRTHDNPNYVPGQLYGAFLEHASETDLEEILIYQTATAGGANHSLPTSSSLTLALSVPNVGSGTNSTTAAAAATATHQLLASAATTNAFPTILKCIPNVKSTALKATNNTTYKTMSTKTKTLKVPSIS